MGFINQRYDVHITGGAPPRTCSLATSGLSEFHSARGSFMPTRTLATCSERPMGGDDWYSSGCTFFPRGNRASRRYISGNTP